MFTNSGDKHVERLNYLREKPLKKQRSEVPVKGLMLYQDHSKVERKSKSEVS